MIDHDRLFKELLSTFFVEFLQLFLPAIAQTIDPESIRFLPQEYFADLTAGEDKIIDLLVEVKQAGQEAAFLIHIEAQSSVEAEFPRRMFFYFARLYQKYLQRVYPIVVFSFDAPYREQPSSHTIEFPNRKILEFSFEPIQLNRLNWRDYLNQPNPIAAALMAKMRIAPDDRPKVKAECLRLLATLRLDPARTRLISGFVDTYLRLNAAETTVFQSELGKMDPVQREGIMQIVTSWMEQGIAEGITQGIAQGVTQGERSLILRQLTRRLGDIPEELRSRIAELPLEQLDILGEALLDFRGMDDLTNWLRDNASTQTPD